MKAGFRVPGFSPATSAISDAGTGGFFISIPTSEKIGFSLVEIIVALSIMAFLGFTLISLVRGAKSEADFTTEHFTSMLISQKVMQDVSQENETNPVSAFQTLGMDSALSASSHLIDGASIYFSYVEDRDPPWFHIDPTIDGSVDKRMEPLFTEIRDFEMDVKGKRLAPPTDPSEMKNLWISTVSLSWKTATGPGKYAVNCIFASPVGEKKIDLAIDADNEKIEKEACRIFYGETTIPLRQILSQKGGDYQTIIEAAKIRLLCSNLLDSKAFKDIIKRTKELEKKEASLNADASADFYDCVKELADIYYEIAKESFTVMYNLIPSLQLIKNNFDKEHFGEELWANRYRFTKGLRNFKLICNNFTQGVYWARRKLEELGDERLEVVVGPKKQQRILMKVFDLHRILSVIGKDGNTENEYKTYLESMKSRSEGRDPAMYRLVSQELTFHGNFQSLLINYPTLKIIDQTINVKLSPIMSFLNTKCSENNSRDNHADSSYNKE